METANQNAQFPPYEFLSKKPKLIFILDIRFFWFPVVLYATSLAQKKKKLEVTVRIILQLYNFTGIVRKVTSSRSISESVSTNYYGYPVHRSDPQSDISKLHDRMPYALASLATKSPRSARSTIEIYFLSAAASVL